MTGIKKLPWTVCKYNWDTLPSNTIYYLRRLSTGRLFMFDNVSFIDFSDPPTTDEIIEAQEIIYKERQMTKKLTRKERCELVIQAEIDRVNKLLKENK